MNLQVTKMHRIAVTSGKGERVLRRKKGNLINLIPRAFPFFVRDGWEKVPFACLSPMKKGKALGTRLKERGGGDEGSSGATLTTYRKFFLHLSPC